MKPYNKLIFKEKIYIYHLLFEIGMNNQNSFKMIKEHFVEFKILFFMIYKRFKWIIDLLFLNIKLSYINK